MIKNNERKYFGGELPQLENSTMSCFTDSGRTSLRLILSNITSKKILLPDFLCKVVLDEVLNAGCSYSFYHVNRDLTIDFGSINEEFDVFYRISYFGSFNPIPLQFREKIVIDDFVFDLLPLNKDALKNWYGYTSWRKILEVSDGSILASTSIFHCNFEIDLIAPFAKIKNLAREAKTKFLMSKMDNENDYLDLFAAAEQTLDKQKKTFKASDGSVRLFLYNLLNNEIITNKRAKNYDAAYSILKDFSIDIRPVFCSFLPLLVPDTMSLRDKLMTKKIFLPCFWPKIENVDSVFKDGIVAIPLHPYYDTEEVLQVAKEIKLLLA